MEALEHEEENCTLRALEESLAELRRKRERSGGSPQAQTDPCPWYESLASSDGSVSLSLLMSISIRRSRDLETPWIAAASQLESFS